MEAKFNIQIGNLRAIEGLTYLRNTIRRLGTLSLVLSRLESKLKEMARQLDHVFIRDFTRLVGGTCKGTVMRSVGSGFLEVMGDYERPR
jgi:hypothetical protein